jgi:hypothetical protein
MSQWIPVDPKQLSPQLGAKVILVDVTLSASPYDVPRAVKGGYDEKKKRFIIAFQYIEEEPLTRKRHDSEITALVGKNSGRLLGLEIDVDKVDANQVTLHVITDAIDVTGKEFPRRQINYELAKAALSKYREILPGKEARP